MKTNSSFSNEGNIENKDITEILEDDICLDIGIKTVEIFKKILKLSPMFHYPISGKICS